jgi:hypothetical protein
VPSSSFVLFHLYKGECDKRKLSGRKTWEHLNIRKWLKNGPKIKIYASNVQKYIQVEVMTAVFFSFFNIIIMNFFLLEMHINVVSQPIRKVVA